MSELTKSQLKLVLEIYLKQAKFDSKDFEQESARLVASGKVEAYENCIKLIDAYRLPEKQDIELIKQLIRDRIRALEKQMNILLDNWDRYSEEIQSEYQRVYLSKKSAYEDVLWMIKGYLETPIQ
jgi:hypothetical protein